MLYFRVVFFVIFFVLYFRVIIFVLYFCVIFFVLYFFRVIFLCLMFCVIFLRAVFFCVEYFVLLLTLYSFNYLFSAFWNGLFLKFICCISMSYNRVVWTLGCIIACCTFCTSVLYKRVVFFVLYYFKGAKSVDQWEK